MTDSQRWPHWGIYGEHIICRCWTKPWQNLSWLAMSVIFISVLLWIAEVSLLTTRQPTLQLTMDSINARPLLAGFHAIEHDGRRSYRWTSDKAMIHFTPIARSEALLLSITMRPPKGSLLTAVTMCLNEKPFAVVTLPEQPRQYHLILTEQAAHHNSFTFMLESPTVVIAPDIRSIGTRIDTVALTHFTRGIIYPKVPFVALQTTILTLVALLFYKLTLPIRWIVVGLCTTLIIIMALFVSQLALILPYLSSITIVLLILTVCTYGCLPFIERTFPHLSSQWLRTLWGITLLGLLVRYSGLFYPPFTIHDIGYHTTWLHETISGDLVILTRPLEFHRDIIIYPQGVYVSLLPGLLLGISPQFLLHSMLGVADGVAILSTAFLARRLGSNDRVALFSALLTAFIPISFYILWWGFTTQIIGQTLMAPLALMLLHASERSNVWGWWCAGALLSIALLSHISVTLLTLVWLALAWTLLWLHPHTRTTRRRFIFLICLGSLVTFLLCYAPFAQAMLSQMLAAMQPTQTAEVTEIPRFNRQIVSQLIASGFRTAFHEFGVTFILLGLFLFSLRSTQTPLARTLISSWIGTLVIFLVIEFLTGRQVRYIYFITPLACILIGLTLDVLARRGQSGRCFVGVILLLISLQGAFAWYEGIFTEIRPPVVALTR